MSTFSQGDDTLGPPSSSATSNIALSSGLSHHHQRNFRNPSSASVSQLSPRRLSTVPLQSPHGRFGTHPPNMPSDLLAHFGRSFRPIDWPKMTIHGFPPPPHAAPMNRLVSPGSPPLLPPHGPPRYNTTSYQSVSMPSFPGPPTIPGVDPLQPGMTSTSPDKYDGKTTCRQGRHRTACDRCRKRKNRVSDCCGISLLIGSSATRRSRVRPASRAGYPTFVRIRRTLDPLAARMGPARTCRVGLRRDRSVEIQPK